MEVTYDDQQNINSFNKLNAKAHELEAVIKAKKVEPSRAARCFNWFASGMGWGVR